MRVKRTGSQIQESGDSGNGGGVKLLHNGDDDELLTRAEAAVVLKVMPDTLATWQSTKRHDLPCVKVGARAMYWRSDLLRWLASRTTTPLPETG